jgi:hypothetical protein
MMILFYPSACLHVLWVRPVEFWQSTAACRLHRGSTRCTSLMGRALAQYIIVRRNDSLSMTRAAVFLALTFLLAGKALTERVEVIDGIAAIVNNDVVTLSQVRDLIGARERSLREIYRGAELENKLKEMRLSAIKDLIDRQLILQ